MKQKELSGFTNQELAMEEKKRKTAYLTNCVFFGMMCGIAIYSTVKNGVGFFTFFPLFFIPIAANMRASYKAAQKEMKSRSGSVDNI